MDRVHGLWCTESMRFIKYQSSTRRSPAWIKPSELLCDDLISIVDLRADDGPGSSSIDDASETGDGETP
jgi:hypothetical protein